LRVFDGLVFMEVGQIQTIFSLGVVGNEFILFNKLSCPVIEDFYGYFFIQWKKKELKSIRIVFYTS